MGEVASVLGVIPEMEMDTGFARRGGSWTRRRSMKALAYLGIPLVVSVAA
jgi:hypothetical protein